MEYVYVIGPDGGPYKIGRASNPEGRLRDLQVGSYETLQIHHLFETDDSMALEALMHSRFKEYRIRGEWFTCELSTILGEKPRDPADIHITAEQFRNWVRVMRDTKPSHNRRQCAALLGFTDEQMADAETNGGGRLLELACKAVYARLDVISTPWL